MSCLEFRVKIFILKLVVVERIGFYYFVLVNIKGIILQLFGRIRWGCLVIYFDFVGLGVLFFVVEKMFVGNGLLIINSVE